MSDPTNEALLEAAFEAVIAHGYAGATTRRIAQLAGVNEVTLFRKFGSKAKLLKEVVHREAQGMLEHSIHYTGNLEEDMLAIVEGYQALIRRRGRGLPVLLVELPRHAELQDLIKAPLIAIQAMLELLTKYQAAGRLLPGVPTHMLLALITPLVATELISQRAPGLIPPLDPHLHVGSWLRAYGQPATTLPDHRLN
jgi:AcrR family transcriptional regulator